MHVHVIYKATHGDKAQRAEDGHGDGEKDDERKREAFVLGRESEIDDEKTEAEDGEGLTAGLDLFERETGPLVLHALQHVLLRDLLHRGEAF